MTVTKKFALDLKHPPPPLFFTLLVLYALDWILPMGCFGCLKVKREGSQLDVPHPHCLQVANVTLPTKKKGPFVSFMALLYYKSLMKHKIIFINMVF
jgi:hypothetical protein